MKKLLTLLERDCTLSRDQLAAAAGMSREQVDAAIEQMEKEKIIRGYQALVDWDQVQPEAVTALIQVNVTPQSIDGYDRIAERIYQYEEVESMYLMSGTYDMTVLISGRTLREVAEFVGNRLAPIEGVTGTSTHFILKRYKEQHLTFRKKQEKEERFVLE
ncbi:MAG: Lrp/AsnC family transcriptional regulator [Oscillospiraceae bacterium]|jgi:DNA-binding Lrp family transcriptional regulator|nr:Lrp/AsnC family transcriptional regulator [Oscillospiraceae bacterium]MBO5917776.1 Lrp/AsnC family transcriptional regulator [Oscillospiraceae bacterium]